MNKIENAIMNLKSLYNQADLYGFQIDTINLAIEALEEKLNNRWIPISEKLPEKDDWYNITVGKSEKVFSDYYDTKHREWQDYCNSDIIAWRELPEHYKK